jgi:hypothetical protein
MSDKKTYATLEVGKKYRSFHPDHYRGDNPFRVVSISWAQCDGKDRYVYIIQYEDGEIDAFPVENNGGYNPIKRVK